PTSWRGPPTTPAPSSAPPPASTSSRTPTTRSMGSSMLDDLTGWITDVIDALGYVGVAFLVALENVFPPIPSEVVLPLSGFVAGRGDASVVGMVLAATTGSVVGAWILYGIAAAVGPIRLHRFVERFGKWFGVSGEDMTKAE